MSFEAAREKSLQFLRARLTSQQLLERENLIARRIAEERKRQQLQTVIKTLDLTVGVGVGSGQKEMFPKIEEETEDCPDNMPSFDLLAAADSALVSLAAQVVLAGGANDVPILKQSAPSSETASVSRPTQARRLEQTRPAEFPLTVTLAVGTKSVSYHRGRLRQPLSKYTILSRLLVVPGDTVKFDDVMSKPAIWTHMSRVRADLEAAGIPKEVIKSVNERGYYLDTNLVAQLQSSSLTSTL